MPKVTRQSHQGHYRSTPLAPNNQALNTSHSRNTSRSSTNNQLIAQQQQQQQQQQEEANTNSMPQLPSQQHSHSHSHSLAQSYYPTHSTTMQSQPSYHQTQHAYTQGGPVQHPQSMSSQQYTHIQSAPQTQPAPTHSLRPSSGAWNPQDDQTLMAARAGGMNWAPIQASYFPTKTPNACRKRHERLMERRNASDWDGLKLENLAKNYMSMRREIWSGLAAQTGEKWAVVEAKCMSSGLKNLQAAARSGSRRERLGINGGVTGVAYTDDSGIGLDLGDGEELDEMEGGVGDGDEYADSEGSGNGYGGVHAGMQQYVSGGHHGSGRPQYQQRLPSMDMGIGAIINRTN